MRLPVAPYIQKIGEQEGSPEMYNTSSCATCIIQNFIALFFTIWYHYQRGGDIQKISGCVYTHTPKWNRVKLYYGCCNGAGVSPYYLPTTWYYLLEIYKREGFNMNIIDCGSLLCDIILVGFVIYDHYKHQ